MYIKKWRDAEGQTCAVTVADIAASFQEAVIDVLVHKVMTAGRMMGVSAVAVAGGVACNGRLRARMLEAGEDEGIRVYFPRPAYCTDNGAMIALAGYHRITLGEQADLSVDARSRYPIQDLLSSDSRGMIG